MVISAMNLSPMADLWPTYGTYGVNSQLPEL